MLHIKLRVDFLYSVWNISYCKNSAKYFEVLILNLSTTAGLDFFFPPQKRIISYACQEAQAGTSTLYSMLQHALSYPSPIDKVIKM